MYKSNTNITVRYVETDQMGIVHHSNYYVYFEIAREDLISNIGMSYKDMEDLGIMMPIIETQCRYKGKTMQTFVDKNSFRIINLKKKHPNIWAKLVKLQNPHFG